MNPPGYRHTALEIKCYSHITSVKDLIGASRKEFIMSTEENAQKAFAGESQANRKYSAFAEKAGAEGYSTVAKIFKAASEAEAIHAKRILFILDAVGTTEENLKTAMEGENYEFTEMYPAFVAEAKKERKNEASIVFTHAMRAEEVHANIYLQALEAVRDGKDLDAEKVFLCPVCGNIELGTAPEKCPICGVPHPTQVKYSFSVISSPWQA